MLERGRGFLPDDPELVAAQLEERHIGKLVGAAGGPAVGRVDYTRLLEEIPNQRITSSCVGQSLATAIFLNAALGGAPIPRPSAKLFYDYARLEDAPYEELRDDGSRPLAAIGAACNKGMVTDSDWPLTFGKSSTGRTTSNVNVLPPLGLYQKALASEVSGWYLIEPGPGAARMCKHALLRGYFPIFRMEVDEAYEQLASRKVFEGLEGRSVGAHMQAMAGFDDGRMFVPGSWGLDFGERGIVEIADSFIDDPRMCGDFIVVTTVPRRL